MDASKLLNGLPRMEKPKAGPTTPGEFPADWLAKYPYEVLERVAIITENGDINDETALQMALKGE